MDKNDSELYSDASSQKSSAYKYDDKSESKESSSNYEQSESQKSSSNNEPDHVQKTPSSFDESMTDKSDSSNQEFIPYSGSGETGQNVSKKIDKFIVKDHVSFEKSVKNYVVAGAQKTNNYTFDPEVRVYGDDPKVLYTPQMPSLEEFDFIEELGVEAYNKIKEVRDLIEQEYPLRLEVHPEDLQSLGYYKGHKYEGKPFTDYVYYG